MVSWSFQFTYIVLAKLKLYKSFHLQTWMDKNNKVNQPIGFITNETPLVSIIIPVYNNIHYTERCLRSIYHSSPKHSYEIIIVNDCSTDQTQEILSHIKGLTIVTNPTNSGFIISCNKGAQIAKGLYVLFLNNDTQVLPHWLDELVATFSLFPDAGLVGSKLIYPNGQLQEAGGIIWNDASGCNFGRLDHPNKPEYNYLREVDYCSGASIMVPRALFLEVGGFDERYRPAYYEDTDLAFSIRQKGYKVLYQPLSVVIHFEGISSGTDINKGVKSHQPINAVKFYSKWKTVLNQHGSNSSNLYLEKERKINKRLLYIDGETPKPDHDAGSLVSFQYMKILLDLGFKITFIPIWHFRFENEYTKTLQRMGIECLYTPFAYDIKHHLKKYGSYYDVAIIHRVSCAIMCIDHIIQYSPQTKIIFNTADLHFLRLARQADIEKNSAIAKQAKELEKIETDVMRKSDCTILISEKEREIISHHKDIKISVIPLILDIPGCKKPFADRKNILFIGNYRHTPNVDAVLFFVKNIWPLIKKKQSDLKFYIIGSNVSSTILALASDDIKVIGYVENLADYFDYCRLAIAPLRYGAGIKGKIGSSMCYGLPCVATTIAAEGMGLIHGKDIIIADDPEAFSDSLVSLYTNETTWNTVSKNGLEFVKKHYSYDAGKQKIATLLKQLTPTVTPVSDPAAMPCTPDKNQKTHLLRPIP